MSIAHYTIKQIGSRRIGWGLLRDKEIIASHPSVLYIAAFLDAMNRGASSSDAHLVAEAVISRPDPSYEERMQHFTDTGPWRPAQDPFAKLS
jgi:hypothetical protein